ncbi:mitochondrial 54S ribosomal protein uL2m [Kockiozyma suomiensis]|uniref:mitochondrial 54S ribosomal protein uL2m n=1 Tax=Kockiozyma suomiensis TaxID=1337062 RepID=UPI003343B5BB
MSAALVLLRRATAASTATRPFLRSTTVQSLHTTAVLSAKNMPKKTVKSVPLPRNKRSLEQMGLDTKRAAAANLNLAAATDADLAVEIAGSGRIARKDAKSINIKKKKPRTPGLRWFRRPVHEHLWKGRPVRALTIPKRKTGGRNHTGRITAKHIGGGHKRRLRVLDFERREGGTHTVVRIEYDPGRTAHIALLHNDKTQKLSYVLAAEGLRSGDKVESFREGIPADVSASDEGQIDSALLASRTNRRGNCMPLSMVPIGTVVHAIGLYKNGPGVLCRAAGSFARLLSKDEDKQLAAVRLKSGEERWVPLEACATIGTVSNAENLFLSLGKAGRKRWMGRRPVVRGLAMNANEHPHGGGRGKSKGNVPSQSAWGTLAKGYKTRFGKNINKHKIRDRPRGYESKARAVQK